MGLTQPDSESPEPDGPTFQFGLLTHTTAGLLFDPVEMTGFTLRRLRPKVRGRATTGLNYFVQAELARGATTTILDAVVTWALDEATSLNLGIFKTPFSSEFLRSLGALDFVDRSRIVNILAPNREVGISLRRDWEQTTAHVGFFNGNTGLTNDDNRFLYVGRVEHKAAEGFVIGFNGAFARDENYRIPALGQAFEGNRILLGADTDYRSDPWGFTAEAIWSTFSPEGVDDSISILGSQFSGFYNVNTRHQVLLRLDYLDLNDTTSTLVIAGYTWFQSDVFKLQVNLIQPLEDEGTTSVVAQTQLSF